LAQGQRQYPRGSSANNPAGSHASPARKYSYDYDRYGNRWGQMVTAGSGYNTQLSFNSSNNRVTTAGFTFDTSGNLTANATGPTFSYDQENFMLTVGSNTCTSMSARILFVCGQ
jgi:YD repeat-containing protein